MSCLLKRGQCCTVVCFLYAEAESWKHSNG